MFTQLCHFCQKTQRHKKDNNYYRYHITVNIQDDIYIYGDKNDRMTIIQRV